MSDEDAVMFHFEVVVMADTTLVQIDRDIVDRILDNEFVNSVRISVNPLEAR